jgi:hemolysin activation/secretion protein
VYTVSAAFACAFGPTRSLAQVFAPFERPGDIRPEIPEPAPPQRPEFTLPPLPSPPADDLSLSMQPRVVAREFLVTGSTVFSDPELARITAPYLGRPLGAEDLERLRQELTLLYLDAGYLNSGAVLPDQDVRDGVVHYRIVEGRLVDVEVEGNRWFRDGYLRSRILRGAHTPLDVADLERELQLLQQDPRIRRVQAELLPGERPGEARLRARFDEELPFFASLEFSNHDSPSIGQYRIQLDLADRNLTGWGDVLRLMGAWTQGLWEGETGYEIPITPWDTTLGTWFRYGTSDVVEQPFDEIDISSRARTIGLELRQPVYRTERSSLALALTAENRQSESYLLGERFPFEEGTEDGQVVVSVLRLRQDWLYRDLHQVVALRSQLSIGLDVLGATNAGCAFDLTGLCLAPEQTGGDAIPDAHFVAWLGQFQWVRRFDRWWGVEAVIRTDIQLASQPLFSLEQFSVGGHQSVRGYRENQLVRDNGLASSLELRIPLWSDAALGLDFQLAPFFDIGRSWNTKGGEASPRTLISAGVGLRTSLTRFLHGELYWGHRIRHVDEPENHDLQDDGVQFSLTASF